MSLFSDQEPVESLCGLHDKWRGCKKCYFSKSLKKKPCLPIIGTKADVLVLGQWPGLEDMDNSIPFSGPQGKVCKNFLFEAGFNPVRLAFTNSLMCTPPAKPSKAFINNCSEHIDELLNIAAPKLIITLGSIAQERLGIEGNDGIYRGFRVTCCPHPAAIARAKTKEEKDAVTDAVKAALARAYTIYEAIKDSKNV